MKVKSMCDEAKGSDTMAIHLVYCLQLQGFDPRTIYRLSQYPNTNESQCLSK